MTFDEVCNESAVRILYVGSSANIIKNEFKLVKKVADICSQVFENGAIFDFVPHPSNINPANSLLKKGRA